MLPILFSDTGATSQDGSHSAIFRMQGPEGCEWAYWLAAAGRGLTLKYIKMTTRLSRHYSPKVQERLNETTFVTRPITLTDLLCSSSLLLRKLQTKGLFATRTIRLIVGKKHGKPLVFSCLKLGWLLYY